MRNKGRILVADDEASLRILLKNELSREGYIVETVSNGEEALRRVREDFFNVLLLDIQMPLLDGISVLKEMKEDKSETEVIMLTGNASIDSAVLCVREGAFEFIRKPYELNELLAHIEKALQVQKTSIDNKLLRGELLKSRGGAQLVGRSRKAEELKRTINQVASSSATVLILGESGAGKEVTARAIHESGVYHDTPFVAVNCASLSETLLESELFGHEKGAFTDAKSQKRGLAEMANGGTLFLDEIGELPLQFQAKLLRFLETGDIRRVGGTKDIKLNVRILCATNRPLEELVQKKEFRADLYYRLNVLSVTVPPLRERPDDIPLLVQHILEGLPFSKSFSESAMKILVKYNWPGNVRELKNVIERSCILSPEDVVGMQELSFLDNSSLEPVTKEPEEYKYSEKIIDDSSFENREIMMADGHVMSMKELERWHIVNVLKYVNGRKNEAASLLKINPKTLYYKMKNFNIKTEFK